MIIAIDGPVATGKSTIAKKLARSIGYIYYDTGAMYRAVTFDILQKKIALDDPAALKNCLDSFDFKIKNRLGDTRYFLHGEDITDKIRTEEVSQLSSRVSANPFIRERMVQLQREYAHGVNAVFEGRDMGTTVFPDADLKIFLTGRDEVRAKRRYEEMKARFPNEAQNFTMETILADLKKRDQFDMTRASSPLKKAPDAFEIDTSDLTIDEIVNKILECKDIANARRKRKTI